MSFTLFYVDVSGIEPEALDLRLWIGHLTPFGRPSHQKIHPVPTPGLEPGTSGLKALRSIHVLR